MNDAPLTLDGASAASAGTTSPSIHLLPLSTEGEGDKEVKGEGEGLEDLSGSEVAVSSGGKVSSSAEPPPLCLSVLLPLLCCSQSASNRPENQTTWL